jgi:hypothetical protein
MSRRFKASSTKDFVSFQEGDVVENHVLQR